MALQRSILDNMNYRNTGSAQNLFGQNRGKLTGRATDWSRTASQNKKNLGLSSQSGMPPILEQAKRRRTGQGNQATSGGAANRPSLGMNQGSNFQDYFENKYGKLPIGTPDNYDTDWERRINEEYRNYMRRRQPTPQPELEPPGGTSPESPEDKRVWTPPWKRQPEPEPEPEPQPEPKPEPPQFGPPGDSGGGYWPWPGEREPGPGIMRNWHWGPEVPPGKHRPYDPEGMTVVPESIRQNIMDNNIEFGDRFSYNGQEYELIQLGSPVASVYMKPSEPPPDFRPHPQPEPTPQPTPQPSPTPQPEPTPTPEPEPGPTPQPPRGRPPLSEQRVEDYIYLKDMTYPILREGVENFYNRWNDAMSSGGAVTMGSGNLAFKSLAGLVNQGYSFEAIEDFLKGENRTEPVYREYPMTRAQQSGQSLPVSLGR